jgi:hypothetical protein
VGPEVAETQWLERPRLEQAVREALGTSARLREVELKAHRPGSRAVVRVVVEDGPQTFELGLKFRARRLAQVFAGWRTLAEADIGFSVPEPVALLEERGCIVFRWVAGEKLTAALRNDEGQLAATAGAAIRTLHEAPIALRRTFEAGSELSTLLDWIERAERSGHPRGEALRRLAANFDEELAGHEPLTPGHRDFYPWQVLATDPLTLLDLDEAAMCELALDVGNFVAHLQVDGLPDAVEPFLSRAVGGDRRLQQRVELYRRTTLARLSAVYWVRGARKRALSVPLG